MIRGSIEEKEGANSSPLLNTKENKTYGTTNKERERKPKPSLSFEYLKHTRSESKINGGTNRSNSQETGSSSTITIGGITCSTRSNATDITNGKSENELHSGIRTFPANNIDFKFGFFHGLLSALLRLSLSGIIVQYSIENQVIWPCFVGSYLILSSISYDIFISSSWVNKLKTKECDGKFLSHLSVEKSARTGLSPKSIILNHENKGATFFTFTLSGMASSSFLFAIAEMGIIHSITGVLPISLLCISISLTGRLIEEVERHSISRLSILARRARQQTSLSGHISVPLLKAKLLVAGAKINGSRRYFSAFKAISSLAISASVTQFFDYSDEKIWRTVFVGSIYFLSFTVLLLENYKNNQLNHYHLDDRRKKGGEFFVKFFFNLFFLSMLIDKATSINIDRGSKVRWLALTTTLLLASIGLGAIALSISAEIIPRPNNSTYRFCDRIYLDESLLFSSLFLGAISVLSFARSCSKKTLSIISPSCYDSLIAACSILSCFKTIYPETLEKDSRSFAIFISSFAVLSVSTTYIPYLYDKVASKNILSEYSSILAKPRTRDTRGLEEKPGPSLSYST